MPDLPPDPPMEPMKGTVKWVETGPEAIANDPNLAGVVTRIGMAVNALTIQIHVAAKARDHKADAVWQRDNLGSLVSAASLTYEAKRLAQTVLPTVRPLLQRHDVGADLLQRVGQLCAGKHPATSLLERARNNLGFHWDYADEVIGRIVESFARNRTIVWVEESAPPSSQTVHRFATEVLAHGLFPEVAELSGTEKESAVNKALEDVRDAMSIIAEFFTLAVVTYLREHDGQLRRQPAFPDPVPPSD